MLTNKIVGHSSNDAVVRDIMDRIADAIQGDPVLVSMTEYAHSFKIDGKRHATGMRTFVININDGDPDLSVEYNNTSCCD